MYIRALALRKKQLEDIQVEAALRTLTPAECQLVHRLPYFRCARGRTLSHGVPDMPFPGHSRLLPVSTVSDIPGPADIPCSQHARGFFCPAFPSQFECRAVPKLFSIPFLNTLPYLIYVHSISYQCYNCNTFLSKISNKLYKYIDNVPTFIVCNYYRHYQLLQYKTVAYTNYLTLT